MPASKRKGFLAFGRQTAKGTPLAIPTFAVPIIGGGPKPVRDREDLGITGSSAARRGQYVARARGEGTVTILAHPEALGLLLYMVMGAQSAAGTDPTVHEFTMADDIPQDTPLTVWASLDEDWWRFPDTYVSQLVLRGASGGNVEVEAEMLSLDYGHLAGEPAGLPAIADAAPRFKYIGSTISLEADAATPVEVTNAEGVELVIRRALELRYGASLTPQMVVPEREVDFSATITYSEEGNNQGWDFLEGAALGDVGATGGPTQDLLRGSFSASFGRHPEEADRELSFVSNGANWEYDVERPDPDPGGGPIEMEPAGMVVDPDGTGGTEVTITLANDTAGVY